MEFVIMMAFAIIISMLFLASAAGLLVDTSEEQRLIEMDAIGYMIQDEVILAATVSDGYERTFEVPHEAGRFSYEIANDATTITLSSGSTTRTYDIPTMTGVFIKGKNKISNSEGIKVNW